jgi:hypothetical protein
MHLVYVYANFRISAWLKYAMSGVCLSRAVWGLSALYNLIQLSMIRFAWKPSAAPKQSAERG